MPLFYHQHVDVVTFDILGSTKSTSTSTSSTPAPTTIAPQKKIFGLAPIGGQPNPGAGSRGSLPPTAVAIQVCSLIHCFLFHKQLFSFFFLLFPPLFFNIMSKVFKPGILHTCRSTRISLEVAALGGKPRRRRAKRSHALAHLHLKVLTP